MRKAIQIATTCIPLHEGLHSEVHSVLALCDDGSIWELATPCRPTGRERWLQLPSLPQQRPKASQPL